MAQLAVGQSSFPVQENGTSIDDERFSVLDERVRSRLSSVFASGLCLPSSIDDRAVGYLAELLPQQALEALDKFEAGLAKSDVRNHSAFLSSVIKRLLRPGGPSLEELAPQAQQVLEQLFKSGHLKRTDLDQKCLRILASHPPEFQVFALDTFAERSLRGIRNIAAYFTTHLLRTEERVRCNQLQLPPINPPTIPPQVQQQLLLQQQLLQQQQQLLMGAAVVPSGPIVIPSGMGNTAGVGGIQQGAAGMLRGTGAPAVAPMAASAAAAPGPKHYGVEQAEWGVRIDEFHGLSPLAKYVHPAAALRLQELWDSGNKLVSLLDDSSWEALAGLDAAHALQTVKETSQSMALVADDIPSVNAIFVKVASNFPKRQNAPHTGNVSGGIAAMGGPVVFLAGAGSVGQLASTVGPAGGLAFQQQMQQAGGLQGGGLLGPQGLSNRDASNMVVMPPGQQGPGAGLQMQLPLGGAMLGVCGFQGVSGVSSDMIALPTVQPQLSSQPQQMAMAGGGLHQGGSGQLVGPIAMLAPSLQQRITIISNSSGGLVRPEHFDAKIVGFMQNLGEYDALHVLEELAHSDFSAIRNVPAFVMGILKKHSQGGDHGAFGGHHGDRGGGRGGCRGRDEEGARPGRSGISNYSRRYEPY